jgi:hypothetical protein
MKSDFHHWNLSWCNATCLAKKHSSFGKAMDKIPAVEAARALMNEATAWSVMKWLREKKTVRKAADQANAALDQSSQSVRERWPQPMRSAYEGLAPRSNDTANKRGQPRASAELDAESMRAITQSREKDDEAYRARMDAEKTFDDAEKQLSTSLAREGCRKAILSWDLHEKAIRKAETLIRSK